MLTCIHRPSPGKPAENSVVNSVNPSEVRHSWKLLLCSSPWTCPRRKELSGHSLQTTTTDLATFGSSSNRAPPLRRRQMTVWSQHRELPFQEEALADDDLHYLLEVMAVRSPFQELQTRRKSFSPLPEMNLLMRDMDHRYEEDSVSGRH